MLNVNVVFSLQLIIFQVFGNEFKLPAATDPSTSDPYEIYLVNTFPLETYTIKKYQRKVFAFDILSESLPVYDFIKEKFEREGEMQIYVGDISAEDGTFQWSPRLISENFDNLHSNPTTKIEENSMSLFCSKEATLNQPEIIVNIDTIQIPPANKSTILSSAENEEKSFSSSKDFHRFTIGDLTVWKKYQKINKFPNINEGYNLKVDIYWEKWSCCSACCCSEITCGQGYETSKASCERVSSHKHRRGFLSFFKIDPFKPIEIITEIELMLRGTDLFSESIEEVVQTFDLYLSSSPYAFTGIPVHSTLLQSEQSWLILELFLNEYFQYRNESESFGQLGLFIDSETCEKDTVAPQNAYQPLQRYPSESDICDYHGVEDVVLKDKESVIDVDEGLSFRFAIDEAEYGELLSIKWKAGQSKLSKFDPRKSCSAQRIFADNHYLIILKVEKDDSNLPYIVKVTLKATGEVILLKLSLQFKSKAKPSKYTNQIFKWLGIAGGVLAVFIIVVVIVHIIQVRSLKRKLKQTAAAAATTAATKTNDQV
uniref:Uncharacterized protein n=1 Tax=Panagrolaimus sp. ES5 TaxID=591445 RepID=A0AC34FA25_9BILA